MNVEDPKTQKGEEDPLISPKVQATASAELSKVADRAKDDLDAVKEQAAEDVRELSHRLGEKTEEAVSTSKSFAAEQKDLAAGQLNGIADALEKVASELERTEQPTVARYARDIAAGVSGIGKTIEDRDVDDLMGLAQDFGRKQPVAFLGVAALAGFVSSRFAMASTHRRASKPTTHEKAEQGKYRPEGSSTYRASPDQNRSGGQ